MTLEEAELGRPLRVESLRGLRDGETAYLSGLGIRPGASLTKIVPTPLKDPVECLVGSQLLAVGRRMFGHIIVEPLARVEPIE